MHANVGDINGGQFNYRYDENFLSQMNYKFNVHFFLFSMHKTLLIFSCLQAHFFNAKKNNEEKLGKK